MEFQFVTIDEPDAQTIRITASQKHYTVNLSRAAQALVENAPELVRGRWRTWKTRKPRVPYGGRGRAVGEDGKVIFWSYWILPRAAVQAIVQNAPEKRSLPPSKWLGVCFASQEEAQVASHYRKIVAATNATKG